MNTEHYLCSLDVSVHKPLWEHIDISVLHPGSQGTLFSCSLISREKSNTTEHISIYVVNECKFIETAHTVAQIINMEYIIKWEMFERRGRCAEINFKWLSITV